jgi:hypothetical protein
VKPQKPGSGKIPYEGPADAALRALRGHLELVEIEAALGVYLKSREHLAGWQPPPREWVELIKGLVEHHAWESAIMVMQHYEREMEAPSSRVRLKLAQLLIQHQERPARALKVLGQIPEGSLPEPLEVLRREIAEQARQMLDDGVLELGDEV